MLIDPGFFEVDFDQDNRDCKTDHSNLFPFKSNIDRLNRHYKAMFPQKDCI
jgi:hypothetical protein